MNCKRMLALALCLALLLTLAGCGVSKKYKNEVDGLTTYYFGDDEDIKNFPAVSNTLDPQQVYAGLEYTEKMFHGQYVFDGKVEDLLKSGEMISFDYIGTDDTLTTGEFLEFPGSMHMGRFCNEGRRNREHEWAELAFYQADGQYRKVACTYTVSGNTVSFTPVSLYEIQYDENYVPTGLTYELSDQVLTYTFAFRGPYLTLTRGGNSVTLCAYSFTADNDSIGFFGMADPNSPSLPDINSISCHIYDNSPYASLLDSGDYGEEGYVYHDREAVSYREDGLLTMTWYDEDDQGNDVLQSRQFVAFVGGSGALILADGNTVYYYNQSEDSYVLETVSQGMTDEELLLLEAMEAAKLEAIVEKKEDLLTDLSAAFQAAGLSVQINTVTGEIALDSTVLFGFDQYAVSEEGKQMLSKFMQIYTSVVYNEKYDGFISRVLVEGHTDTEGAYERNLTLSEARANAVMEYCLGEDAGIDAAYRQLLAEDLSAVGYSWDYPVYADDGSVDMDASRRVAFRFIVNLEQ